MNQLLNHTTALRYFCGFITVSLFAIGLARFNFVYQYYSDPYPLCLEHADRLFYIFRNLGIVSLLLLATNFTKRWPELFNKISLISWTLSRYFIIYILIPETVNKILGTYYQYSFSLAYERLMNAQPRHLVWQVYAESDSYEILIGIAETIILLMLAFRRTAFIGAMLLLPIILNNFSLALVFESCNLYRYITLLSFLLGVIVYRIPDIIDWMREQTFPKLFQFKPKEFNLFYGAIAIIKLIAIIGFMMQWLWSVDRYRNYNMWAQDHPIVGIWTVDSICTQTSEFPEFNKLIFEKSRDAVVEVEDSLTNFKYIVDTLYNQMDLYDFWEFRSIDLKGKYNFIDSNRIEYVGRNNKDSIFLQLSKVPNSPD